MPLERVLFQEATVLLGECFALGNGRGELLFAHAYRRRASSLFGRRTLFTFLVFQDLDVVYQRSGAFVYNIELMNDIGSLSLDSSNCVAQLDHINIRHPKWYNACNKAKCFVSVLAAIFTLRRGPPLNTMQRQ